MVDSCWFMSISSKMDHRWGSTLQGSFILVHNSGGLAWTLGCQWIKQCKVMRTAQAKGENGRKLSLHKCSGEVKDSWARRFWAAFHIWHFLPKWPNLHYVHSILGSQSYWTCPTWSTEYRLSWLSRGSIWFNIAWNARVSVFFSSPVYDSQTPHSLIKFMVKLLEIMLLTGRNSNDFHATYSNQTWQVPICRWFSLLYEPFKINFLVRLNTGGGVGPDHDSPGQEQEAIALKVDGDGMCTNHKPYIEGFAYRFLSIDCSILVNLL